MNVRSLALLSLVALVFIAPLAASAAASTTKLTLTVPNGGEQWEIGAGGTILWTPYGYDPDINPAGDVEAYLEKRLGFLYIPVGKIMPSGKASIHWGSDINEYGTYPKPGQYYIRIKNTKTGQQDRSDRPLTLTARTVDLKVNRSDGPLRLRSGEQVTLSWSSKGSFNTCQVRGVSKELNDGADWNSVISELPANGTLKAYVVSNENVISIDCERSDGQWRSDSVQVRVQTNTPPAAAPSVKIVSPNGSSSQISSTNEFEILYEASGVRSVSIALYKNNMFSQWIVRDIIPQSYEKGGYRYVWKMDKALIDKLITDDQIYKIYITGKTKTPQGYVEDKSDEFFRFFAPGPLSKPVCAVTTNETEIFIGDSVTINWQSELADYSILPGGDKGPANGSETYYPEVTKTYTYEFVGPGGKTSCSVTIEVEGEYDDLDPPVITTFKAVPNFVMPKKLSTLLWEVQGAQRCVLKYGTVERSVNAVKGTLAVYPLTTTKYQLWCANDPGTGKDGPSASKTTTVSVVEYRTTDTERTNTTAPATNGTTPTNTITPTNNTIQESSQPTEYYRVEAAVGAAVSGVLDSIKSIFGW